MPTLRSIVSFSITAMSVVAVVSAGDACVLKTNKISQLYEISKDGVDGCKGFTSTRPPYGRNPASYGGLCNSDMLNRVACNAQEALDDDSVGSTIYACQKDGDQYIWKKVNQCAPVQPSVRRRRYNLIGERDEPKWVSMCAWAGQGDSACCGGRKLRSDNPATCSGGSAAVTDRAK